LSPARCFQFSAVYDTRTEFNGAIVDGYSGFTVAVSRSHEAKWLFHQEKATLNDSTKRLDVLWNRSSQGSSSFGVISTTGIDNRVVQGALMYIF
jgi:hypothetical protein